MKTKIPLVENSSLCCTYVTGFWKTLRMGFFVKIEFDVSLISSTLELTQIARFVCDRATAIRNEKLRSKGVAMHAYGVSVYHACTGNQLGRLGRSRPK